MSPAVRAVYHLLEVSVEPLELNARLQPLLTAMQAEADANTVCLSIRPLSRTLCFCFFGPLSTAFPCFQ